MIGPHKLALSIDVEEWFHSRRWVEGSARGGDFDASARVQALYGQDRPIGEIIRPTLDLLDLLDRHRCRCTFFVLGEVAGWYPSLVETIAARGHEIACHGLYHADMTAIGPVLFGQHLAENAAHLERIIGTRPVGFRAPNLVYEPWATRILEDQGFVYDSSVCASRSIGGKYKGWIDAPVHPYHPSYDAIGRPGNARIVEVPLPAFPLLRITAGSGIMTRVIGLSWTRVALAWTLRHGNSAFYFHPWEVGPRPRPQGHRLRNAVFLRHTGAWMLRAVESLLSRYAGRIVTVRESVDELR